MLIRVEQDKDRAAIRAVNESAFETPAEATLVAALREKVRPFLSLVAERDGAVVGHILFSPVILGEYRQLNLMGLAPMAVSPDYQRQGIGSALVRAGLDECRKLGMGAVVVLGHPEYYPRFGFTPSAQFGIQSEFDVPEEVFMVLELEPGYLQGQAGVIHYHGAFKDL